MSSDSFPCRSLFFFLDMTSLRGLAEVVFAIDFFDVVWLHCKGDLVEILGDNGQSIVLLKLKTMQASCISGLSKHLVDPWSFLPSCTTIQSLPTL